MLTLEITHLINKASKVAANILILQMQKLKLRE